MISVEPDTRRVPNLPPPVPLSTLLPATRPSPFGQLDLLPPRLLPPCAGELPSAPFAAGWRRVTSLSKNGRCRLSLSCSGLSFPRPRAHLFLPSVLPLRFLFPSLSSFLFFFLASLSRSHSILFFDVSLSRTFFPPLSLSLTLYFSPSPLFSALSLPFADSFSTILFLSFSVEREKILSPSRPRPLASPLVLSLHRGCLYSVFHCGSHTCPVAGCPSLACRWRRARDWERGMRDEGSRVPSTGGVRRLARGERRVRERNKISKEGGG